MSHGHLTYLAPLGIAPFGPVGQLLVCIGPRTPVLLLSSYSQFGDIKILHCTGKPIGRYSDVKVAQCPAYHMCVSLCVAFCSIIVSSAACLLRPPTQLTHHARISGLSCGSPNISLHCIWRLYVWPPYALHAIRWVIWRECRLWTTNSQ